MTPLEWNALSTDEKLATLARLGLGDEGSRESVVLARGGAWWQMPETWKARVAVA